jgi:hypothetical protein
MFVADAIVMTRFPILPEALSGEAGSRCAPAGLPASGPIDGAKYSYRSTSSSSGRNGHNISLWPCPGRLRYYSSWCFRNHFVQRSINWKICCSLQLPIETFKYRDIKIAREFRGRAAEGGFGGAPAISGAGSEGRRAGLKNHRGGNWSHGERQRFDDQG